MTGLETTTEFSLFEQLADADARCILADRVCR
jgi:hypothetical protein